MNSAWAILLRYPLSPDESRKLLSLLRRKFPGRGLAVLGLPGRSSGPKRRPLTTRQKEVLHGMVLGKRMKEIGRSLGISHKTAETHRQQLMRRLGIDHLPGLVRYALREGLLDATWLLE